MALGVLAALVAALALAVTSSIAEQDWRLSDLERRQAASPDGVISMDDAAVRQLAASSGRPYALLILFDALHIKERADLKLEELRSEFGLLARTYKGMSSGSEPRLFLCSLEYQQSQESFRVFDVRTLPHVRYLAPGSSRPTEAETVDMSAETHRSAEGLASFIEARTGRKVGPITRPPLLSGRQLALLAAVVAMVAPWAKRKAASLGARTPLHDARVWCAGSILVYFFSVSGGMHNIIRRMPLFMADKKEPGKLVFFVQGNGVQLGAEGFAVGYLYTVLGLALAFVTHLLPSLASKTFQRLAMLVAMLACFWSATKVVSLDNWKTGYSIHAYLPKAWH